MATYTVKHVSGGTYTKEYPATNSEEYAQGELVYWDSGAVTEIANTTGSLIGWVNVDARDGVTASTGDTILVECPEPDCVVEIYADGAATAGTAYDIGTSGQVDVSSTSNTVVRAEETISAAGMLKCKFLPTVLE